MSFEHRNILNEYDTDFHVLYTPVHGGIVGKALKMKAHSNLDKRLELSDEQIEKEIFYLAFDDCRSIDDKEGFLLMCSENELVELVNHLRMIRGV